MNEIENLKKELNQLIITVDEEQKKFLNLKSIRNFLLYYNDLKKYQNEVEELLRAYFKIIREENYYVTKDKSTELAGKYILKIGRYYAVELGFKYQMDLSFAFFWGILADVLLLFSNMLSKIHYIPISTIIVILYFFYLRKFYEEQNKVYGLRY